MNRVAALGRRPFGRVHDGLGFVEPVELAQRRGFGGQVLIGGLLAQGAETGESVFVPQFVAGDFAQRLPGDPRRDGVDVFLAQRRQVNAADGDLLDGTQGQVGRQFATARMKTVFPIPASPVTRTTAPSPR